jgi:hypothetical protein
MEKWLIQHFLGRQKNYVKPQSWQAVTLLRFEPGNLQIYVYSFKTMFCHFYVPIHSDPCMCLYTEVYMHIRNFLSTCNSPGICCGWSAESKTIEHRMDCATVQGHSSLSPLQHIMLFVRKILLWCVKWYFITCTVQEKWT